MSGFDAFFKHGHIDKMITCLESMDYIDRTEFADHAELLSAERISAFVFLRATNLLKAAGMSGYVVG